MKFTNTLIASSAILILGGHGAAQAAASQNYLLVASENASGRDTGSQKHRMVASTGSGVPGEVCVSNNHVLTGGLVPTFGARTTGKPWLTAAVPRFATPKGSQLVSLFGTELNLGSSLNISIGGQAAKPISRLNHVVTTRLPDQPRPGWVPITVSNQFGSSVLPEGIGILPMIYPEPAAAPNLAFHLVFKGSQGDRVVWAAAVAPAAPQAIAGFRYGLALHTAAMLVLPGFTILGPSGEFRFPIPASNYTGNIYIQGLFGTNNPGYAPGSFSNVLRF